MKEFPPRDTTKPAEQQGLFNKFDVRRVDGSDAAGGKHHGCKYFVLDIDHDPAAGAALRAYAEAVKETHPMLAADLVASPLLPQQGGKQIQFPFRLPAVPGRLIAHKGHASSLLYSEIKAFRHGALIDNGPSQTFEMVAAYVDALEAAVLPQVGEATKDDEFSALRLRAICNMLGLANAVPEDNADLLEAQFSVFGMIRGAIELERKAQPQDGRHFLTHETVKAIESKVGSLAAPASLGEAKAVAPEGWQSVPIDPTPQMLARAIAPRMSYSTDQAFEATIIYKTMLAAAPVSQALPIAVEKDAERYRWLKEHHYGKDPQALRIIAIGGGIDEAIDAEIAARRLTP